MFGFFGIILFVVLAVWAWSFLKKEKGLGFSENHESALDILKKRYAKGEVSKELNRRLQARKSTMKKSRI